ncbi:MAG: Smr/MutS family protein [Candidatus Sedimenticola endophacoides]
MSEDNDDFDLFRKQMDGARRQRHDKADPFRRRRRPLPLPPRPEVTGDQEGDGLADLNIETPDELLFQRPGVQHRPFQELRRGYLAPDDTLELHGLRVTEARRELAAFIRHAHRRRMRVVRIIHGKGIGSQERQPILKQKVNQWLRQIDDVLAFCSAPRFDGGTGAAYVLLALKRVPNHHNKRHR